jgi:hypothetical protein
MSTRKWLPERNSPRKRPGPPPPQVIFRAIGLEDTEDGNESAYASQTVEVTLGPKATFKKGSVGRITRQVPADRPIPFAAPGRTRRKRKTHRVSKSSTPPKKRRASSGARFLRLAKEWHRQLDAGEIENQAAIARREAITRARVSQIMSLLRLAPQLQERVLDQESAKSLRGLSERNLRRVVHINSARRQAQVLKRLLT